MEKYIKINDFEKVVDSTRIALYKSQNNIYYITDLSIDENGFYKKVGDIIDVYNEFILFEYDDEVYLYDMLNKRELYRTDEKSFSLKNGYAFIRKDKNYFIMDLSSGQIIESDIDYYHENKSDRYVLYFKNYKVPFWYCIFDTVTGQTIYRKLLDRDDYIDLKGDYIEVKEEKTYTFIDLKNLNNLVTVNDYSKPKLCDNGYILLDKENGIITNVNDKKIIKLDREVSYIKNDYAISCWDKSSENKTLKSNNNNYIIYDLKNDEKIVNKNRLFVSYSNYFRIDSKSKIKIYDSNDLAFICFLDKKIITNIQIFSHYLTFQGISEAVFLDLRKPIIEYKFANTTINAIEYNGEMALFTIKNEAKTDTNENIDQKLLYNYKNTNEFFRLPANSYISSNGIILSDGIVIDPFSNTFDKSYVDDDITLISHGNQKKYYSTISVEGTSSLSNYSKTVCCDNVVDLELEKYNAIVEVASMLTSHKENVKKLIKTT